MITEIVFFNLPKGTTRAEVTRLYETTAGKWATNTDLVEKYYFFDEEKSLGGGVYIWKSREAASRWHGSDYHRMVEELYGSPPQIQILDAIIRVDSLAGNVHLL